MTNCMGWMLCVTLMMSVPVMADETNVVRAVKLGPGKLAGINLPAEESFVAPEDVLEGNHRPRGEVLHYGEPLITEVYEDEPATFRIDKPYSIDEFATVLSGKLIVIERNAYEAEYGEL